MSTAADTPDDAPFIEALSAIASQARVRLLRQLRTPKQLREIQLTPSRRDPGGEVPDRAMARQSLRRHLEQLRQAGVVVLREAPGVAQPSVEYVVNHQALFGLAEQFRDLARLRPSSEHLGPTLVGAGQQPTYRIQGPCLVLVRGLDEGRTFDLTPRRSRGDEWVIGRTRGLDVALDFDPFVSAENSRVVWDGTTHEVEDLPFSRNGTFLNFRPLPRGGRHPLQTGDVIGVGRCLLLFRA